MSSTSKLIVFSDDWGRHPSSCQHLVRNLLDVCDVTWVNTIGMRPPRFDLQTMQRGLEKLRHWGIRAENSAVADESSPQVLNPLMWPSFRTRLARQVNLRLICANLKKNVENLESAVALTTIPVAADLIGRLSIRRWIYYCVDDFSQWPGLDGQTLQTLEDQLIEKADVIVAAGDNLGERIQRRGREPVVITHGVDLKHWNIADDTHPLMKDVERPIALFWGLIDRRLDVNWLRGLNDSMQAGTIVLVGPQQDPDPELLSSLPRVKLVGQVPFQELPQIAAGADALIMPYADLPVTRAMQPLKLKEYLATGRPVIVRRLPATGDWLDCLTAVDCKEAFVKAVNDAFSRGITAAQESGRLRLRDEGWSAKAQSLREVFSSDLSNCVTAVA